MVNDPGQSTWLPRSDTRKAGGPHTHALAAQPGPHLESTCPTGFAASATEIRRFTLPHGRHRASPAETEPLLSQVREPLRRAQTHPSESTRAKSRCEVFGNPHTESKRLVKPRTDCSQVPTPQRLSTKGILCSPQADDSGLFTQRNAPPSRGATIVDNDRLVIYLDYVATMHHLVCSRRDVPARRCARRTLCGADATARFAADCWRPMHTWH